MYSVNKNILVLINVLANDFALSLLNLALKTFNVAI